MASGITTDTKPKLPAHLMYNVAEQLIWLSTDPSWKGWGVGSMEDFRTALPAWRLTCKDFAQMGIVKAALFKSLDLSAEAWNVDLIKNTELTFLLPYVRKVVLRPSPYNLDLDFEDYKDLRSISNDAPSTHIEMATEYKSCRRRARRDKDLIFSGELERVWTRLFGQLQSPSGFVIDSLIGDHPLLPDSLPNSSSGDYDDYEDDRAILRSSSLTNYNDFFHAIVRCVATSKTKIKAVEVDCEMAHFFSGWKRDAWKELHLDSLQALRLHPCKFSVPEEHQEERDDSLAEILDHFLAKCPATLESFFCEGNVIDPAPSMPLLKKYGIQNLRSIELCGLAIQVPDFSMDIAESPHLREIRLRFCCPVSDDDAEWKPLLDAIHHHSNVRRLEFEGVWNRNIYNLSFDFNLDPLLTVEGHLAAYKASRHHNRGNLDLLLYLAKKGPWSEKLQGLYG
ncbi:hypothetical protein H2200_005996 [Cladophialophora chaetospira]|uniref:Uncharacterized protein n=1 Tax=Cladophialophora chaetospira TaxID=386627 RepID=A0AA38XA74_9EURO|nr:hypothetical protein H2200_005996 [Cladophialophora chaetospira]